VKTISLKKVSAVAVASLGFGLLSVVPANAAPATAWTVGTVAGDTTAITLASGTSAPSVGSAVNVNFGAAVGTVAGGADATHGIFATYVGFLSSYPSGGYATTTASATATTTTTAVTGGTTSAATNTISVLETTATAGLTATTVTASSSTGIGKFVFTPTVAGTYTLKVWNDAGNSPDGVIAYNEPVQTIDIVVAARAGISPALSTAYQAGLEQSGSFTATSTTDAVINRSAYPQPVLCAKGTTQCANVLVTVLDTNNVAVTSGYSFGADMSGAGNLGISDTNATYTQAASARSVSLTSPADNIFNVSIWGDGTSGVGTVTIYATDKTTGAKTTIATKKVTFYGTVAKLAVVTDTQAYAVLKAAKGTATGIITGLTATSDTPALLLAATDSAGLPVANLTITATSDNVAIISGGTVAEDLVARDAGYLYGGQGYYLVDVVSASSSTSGQKSVVTYSTTLSTGAKVTTTANFSIGGSVSTETIAFDKTSYAPGEGMVITRTAKDSSGNPVYDGAASPVISFSKAVGGTAPVAGTYANGVSASSKSGKPATVFAPAIGGAFTMQATSGNAASSALSASATVTDANAGLLTQIDALNAKIVALNALIAKIMKKLGVK